MTRIDALTPDLVQAAAWPDIEGLYLELAREPLSRETVEAWLSRWSRLEECLTEAATAAMIAYTCDTGNPNKEATHRRFSVEIMPKADELSVELARRLVDLGYTRPELQTMLGRFRAAIAIFREENVPLIAQLEELNTQYQGITGSMTALWDGQQLPLPQLSPFLERHDRAVRERAYRAMVAPYLERRDDLAQLFDRMYDLRQRLARNAGFNDFRGYAFAAKYRFDYTPADCDQLHAAIEQVVVPAYRRMLEARRARLGLPALRPWDLGVDPYRTDPLRPFRDTGQLAGTGARVVHRVHPAFGAEFHTMIEEGLLDLDSRKGKAPGGYCDTLHFSGRPFIFMNASGVMDDVKTLIHEAGHCFHAFASHRQPLIWQRHPTSEAAELASMSMELLALEHLGPPDGYLSAQDARHARLEALEDVLASLIHIASVDAFQSWIYTSGEGGDPAARDAAWLRIRTRFEPDIDWSGLEQERLARWYRQLHIFLYPFYYIEYGIAQLGALQLWRASLTDPAKAVSAYRAFLSLGATRALPDLYATAGARLIFDAAALEPLIALVEEHIGPLRASVSGNGSEVAKQA